MGSAVRVHRSTTCTAQSPGGAITADNSTATRHLSIQSTFTASQPFGGTAAPCRDMAVGTAVATETLYVWFVTISTFADAENATGTIAANSHSDAVPRGMRSRAGV